MKVLGIDHGNRILGLDILRAFAILFVVYAHSMDILDDLVHVRIVRLFQFDGVTIFFVLSGFLIGRILIKHYFNNNKFGFRQLFNFWARRWLRTLPIYFIVLTALLLISNVLGVGGKPPAAYKYYLFIQNLWYPHPSFFPEAWSLSIEEWFYLLFPFSLFLFALLTRRQNKYIFLFIVFAFFLFGTLYRHYICMDAMEAGVKINTIFDNEIRKVVASRIDSIMFGVFGAYLFVFHRKNWDKHAELCFVLGLLCFYLFKTFPWGAYPYFRGVYSFSLVALGTLLILPKLNAIQYSGKPGFVAKAFTVISLVSYSMYLINLRMRVFANPLLQKIDSTILTYICYWAIVIIISIILYRFIEYPILKLRDKYFKKVRV